MDRMGDNIIPPEIQTLLDKVAAKEGFQDHSISLHEKFKKGDVNIGELFFIKIKDLHSENKREVLVKKASEVPNVRLYYPVAGMYLNESQFYDTIWPTFLKFQEAAHIVSLDKEIPKCYGTDMKKLKEILVLENLKFGNFQTIEYNRFLEKPYFELIFDRYGKFHALSLAYKSKFSKVFREMSNGLFDYWGCLHKMKTIEKSVKTMLHECRQYLVQESDTKMVQKFQEYVAKGSVGFTESCKYTGGHSVILHGDSSSNNLMFRYDKNKKPTDIRFLDFQIVRLGTPVFDLSYCLYSSAKSEVYEELDYFLKIYYDAFSKTLVRYECDPGRSYSFNSLREEWKTYSKFGFIMGLLQIRNKCTREDDPMDVPDAIDNPVDRRVWKMDTKEVKKRSLDLIKHMYKSGFL